MDVQLSSYLSLDHLMFLQNNVNSESLMKEVDETFCSNDKQIIKQTGSELKDTFQRAKDRFGTPIKVLPATVGEKKTTLLDFRAQVKCQVRQCCVSDAFRTNCLMP